jgi:NADH-quinone oxidoreductase subunit J
MTSRPRLATDVSYRKGAGAVLLFAVLAWTFVQAPLPAPQGFGEGSITRSIGFALFDMLELIPAGHGETESFLVAFIVIAVVLDAALDGAVMLARREDDGTVVTAIADGGFLLGNSNETTDDESAEHAAADESAEHAAANESAEHAAADDSDDSPVEGTDTVEDASPGGVD